MEPDSLSFPALITKPQSHLALSGYYFGVLQNTHEIDVCA